MNKQERSKIGEMWMGIGAMYGRDIPKQALIIMLNAINDLDASKVELALNDWVLHKKNRSYPLPADIRAFVNPEVDDDSASKEAASRLLAAVSKFGYTQPNDARAYMGEAAWSVVSRYGGWTVLCEQLGVELDRGVFQAQVRDLIKSHMSFNRMGLHDYKPSLPSGPRKQGLLSAREVMDEALNLIPVK